LELSTDLSQFQIIVTGKEMPSPMSQLLMPLKSQKGDLEARTAEEHARCRRRFHERIEFIERLDRNGRQVLVPVIRRRSDTLRPRGA
jgi:hypothetical protein